jgi:hypothetical protein
VLLRLLGAVESAGGPRYRFSELRLRAALSDLPRCESVATLGLARLRAAGERLKER